MKLLIHSKSLGLDKYFHHTLYCVCDYLSMLGLKLNILVKGVPDNSKQHSFTHLFDAPPTSLCESDPSLLKAPKSPDMFLLRA